MKTVVDLALYFLFEAFYFSLKFTRFAHSSQYSKAATPPPKMVIIQSTQSHMQPCNLSLSSKQLAATAAAYMAFCPDKAQMPTKKPPIRCL